MSIKFDSGGEAVIQQTVSRLYWRQGWALIRLDILVDLVRDCLPASEAALTETSISGLTWSLYAPILYDACLQNEDPSWRKEAHQELTGFLHGLLATDQYAAAPVAKIVQLGLSRTWRQVNTCERPVKFLLFARDQLGQAYLDAVGRQNGSTTSQLSQFEGDDGLGEYELFLKTMEQTLSGDDEATTRHLVRKLIPDYQWALISSEPLVDLALVSFSSGLKGQPARNAIQNTYIRLLYEACKQQLYRHRREQAFFELDHFLRAMAYKNRWYPVEEIVSRALISILEKIDDLQNPGAFLDFAGNYLRAAHTQLIREKKRQEKIRESMQKLLPNYDPPPEIDDLSRILMGALGRLSREGETGRKQAKVILLTYLFEYADREIAARLKIKEGYTPSLRRRGLERLRVILAGWVE